jgi:hypothetical protein
MRQPSFPLFKPTSDEPEDGAIFGVFDVIRNEVQRAALVGSDPEAIERIRFSLDLSAPMEQHLQALASAMGSSRRSLAAKLLTGAILDAVNTLQRSDDRDVEMAAVWSEYRDALDAIRQAPEA